MGFDQKSHLAAEAVIALSPARWHHLNVGKGTQMTHSYRVHYFHLIWSTKRRQPCISENIQDSLYSYIGGIIRKHNGSLIEIGGMPDHIHLLIKLNSLDKFSYIIRDIKSNSSQWIHKTFPELTDFEWQEGYGSFSVSFSSVNGVQKYIQNQPEHHKTITFDQEYKKLLERCGVVFDERFVLG